MASGVKSISLGVRPDGVCPDGVRLKVETLTPRVMAEHDAEGYMSFGSPVIGVPTVSSSRDIPSPAQAASPMDSFASPAATSLIGGLATNMQARILALQQARARRSATPATHVGHPSPPPDHRAARTLKDAGGVTSQDSESHPHGLQAVESTSQNNSKMVLGECLSTALNGSPPIAAFSSAIYNAAKSEAMSQSAPHLPLNGTSAVGANAANGALLGRAHSFRSRQRSTLSERRGMKLDTASVMGASAGPLTAPVDGSSKPCSNTQSEKTPRVRFRPTLKSPENSSSQSRDSVSGGTGAARSNLFSSYNKYIDLKTGSLNFADKACLHAKGIDFSSGTSFRISLDQLEPLAELGAGNYGTVQKVLHKPTNIVMAMKEIRLELDDANFRQIIMELDVLHRCNMDSIVDFYGAFFVEGAVYICMEYMDGGSINNIYQGGIPEKYLRCIVLSVVRGLKQLKEDHNVIHRDVKPTNILCSTSGKVKLCDFGVSGNLVASIARTNIGCQAYMAPERICSGGSSQVVSYTAESDIWSLGLTIIEMSTGTYPYPPEAYTNIFSQLSAIVDGEAPSLDPTKYSHSACDFVSQLLNKNPVGRPSYKQILQHPWLANGDVEDVDMGAFVRERLLKLEHNNTSNKPSVKK